MDNELKMVISRGKVTFTRETATRCSSWKIVAGDDAGTILNVIEDILVELRYPSGLTSVDESLGKYPYGSDWPEPGWNDVKAEEPVHDGVAFQPPKQTAIGGMIDLGSAEPSNRPV